MKDAERILRLTVYRRIGIDRDLWLQELFLTYHALHPTHSFLRARLEAEQALEDLHCAPDALPLENFYDLHPLEPQATFLIPFSDGAKGRMLVGCTTANRCYVRMSTGNTLMRDRADKLRRRFNNMRRRKRLARAA